MGMLMYIYICGHVILTYMEYITRVCSLRELLFNAHICACIEHIHIYCHTYYISYIANIYVHHIKKAFFT